MKRICRFILVLAVMVGQSMVTVVLVLSARKMLQYHLEFCNKSKSGWYVNGLVLASCGMCNFGTKDKTCSLQFRLMKKHIM